MPSSSSSSYVRHITNPTENEISKLTDILVEAFKDDRFGDILHGGDPTLAPIQLRADICAALIGGAVHALTVGPDVDDMVGVAIWFPPGKSLYSSAEQRAAGRDQFLAGMPASLRAWWMDYFVPAMGKLSTDNLGAGYTLNAWSLHLFGVLPGHQGKGYGRALFEYALLKAGETHSPLVVETTTEVNVKIYTKLGFHVVGGTDITSDFGKAHIWLLVKETEAVAV